MDDPEDGRGLNASLNLIADYGTDSDSDDTETRSTTGNEDSDAVDHHEMVLKNNIINACAHGPLSKDESQRDDGKEVTRHMIIDNMESGLVEYEVSEYRDVDFNSDSDSSSDPSISSDSDVESVKGAEEISSGDEEENTIRIGKYEPPKVHGELGLDDLPPIEDLTISLPPQQTTKIGTIASVVDRLVIVQAVPETPPVDIDTVLFLDNGAKTLGTVFDVFGPVTEPHYCVRFNSAEHVRARGVVPGLDVSVAPHTPHTNYVFLADLMRTKGSDASWLNDIEPPPNQIEYSDDEEERQANKARKELTKLAREGGETSMNVPPHQRKTLEAKRNQRPSESSSRFGSGPSKGRNPFSAGFRRNPNAFPRFVRPWFSVDLRTAPPHAVAYPCAPPGFGPAIFPPNLCTPPPPLPLPYVGVQYQFGMNPRMPPPPMPPMNVPPPFGQNAPTFGANYCNMPGPQPQWFNNPPPPGT